MCEGGGGEASGTDPSGMNQDSETTKPASTARREVVLS